MLGLVVIHVSFKIPCALLAVIDGWFELVFGHYGHVVDIIWAKEVFEQTLECHPTVASPLSCFDICPARLIAHDLGNNLTNLLAVCYICWFGNAYSISSRSEVFCTCNNLILNRCVTTIWVDGWDVFVLPDNVCKGNFLFSEVQSKVFLDTFHGLGQPILGIDRRWVVRCLVGWLVIPQLTEPADRIERDICNIDHFTNALLMVQIERK